MKRSVGLATRYHAPNEPNAADTKPGRAERSQERRTKPVARVAQVACNWGRAATRGSSSNARPRAAAPPRLQATAAPRGIYPGGPTFQELRSWYSGRLMMDS